jgi:hypothetical protein
MLISPLKCTMPNTFPFFEYIYNILNNFMSLQYLTDYTGRHTAVVIPIEEWEGIVSSHSDLKILEDQPAKKYKMADFAGTLSKEAGEALQQYVQQSRDEWDSRVI